MSLAITRTKVAGGVGSSRLSLSSVSGTEPVTATEAKEQLRFDSTDEDTLLAAIIAAAREFFEAETGRALVRATYVLTLDRFPPSRHEAIHLPRPPLASVTSIQYVDQDDVTQTWSSDEYTVQTFDGPTARPGRVFPASDTYDWPDTADVPGAVTITYEAGYADDAWPESWRLALMFLIADMWTHREAQVSGTIVSDNKTAMRIINRASLPVMA